MLHDRSQSISGCFLLFGSGLRTYRPTTFFAQYQWRVEGYRTDRLTADARWPVGAAAKDGLQLVVVDVNHRTRQVTAVPTAAIGKDIDAQAFQKLLDQREITREAFVDLVTEAKRQGGKDYHAFVYAYIEKLDEEVPQEPAAQDNDRPDDDRQDDKQTPRNDTVELAD